EEVDQAVMQAAIARARRQSDVFEAGFAQDRRDRIAAPSHGTVALLQRLFDSFHPCPTAATGTWTWLGCGNPMRRHETRDRRILRRSVRASSALYPGVYPAPHAASECLDDRHVGDAAALAHRLEAVAPLTRPQSVDQCRHQLGSRGAQRMPKGDPPAIDVELGRIGADLTQPSERDWRERLVD